jgi:hypothetical protein
VSQRDDLDPDNLTMSEQFRAALCALDGEIAATDARLAALRACRASLAAVMGEDVPTPTKAPPPLAPKAARSAQPRAASPVDIHAGDAADRVLALLQRRGAPVPAADVHAATKLATWASKRVLRELVAAGSIVLTGFARGATYRLAGAPTAPPADSEGDRGARRARTAR